MNTIAPEVLLAEVDDILRNMPGWDDFGHDEVTASAWAGRIMSAIENWKPEKAIVVQSAVTDFLKTQSYEYMRGYRQLLALLNQARSDLRLQTGGTAAVAISKGSVFHYFDEVRKIVEGATQELFFIDPYLDADFVSRYLTHVRPGVALRLLTARSKLQALNSSIEAFVQQTRLSVQLRTSDSIHDRYVFVDRASCYQSGASFKDGAKNAPTTLTQLLDPFIAVWNTYEQLWANARVERASVGQ